MAVVESRVDARGALVGRTPGQALAPSIGPTRSKDAEQALLRPVFRREVEIAELLTAQDIPYVMLRSPDIFHPHYLRLTPHELRLAEEMDGRHTIADLVTRFHAISGRLAPDEVARTIIDLYVNDLLDVSPEEAEGFAVFAGRQRPRPDTRQHRAVGHLRVALATLIGRRIVLLDPTSLVNAGYLLGGRFLFTRVGAWLSAAISLCGLVLFARSWVRGSLSLFLVGDSYAAGAMVLLLLGLLVSLAHESGHALATRRAHRQTPLAGLVLWCGIPSVFIDTSDIWMADRRARLMATASGPGAVLALAGTAQLAVLALPGAAGLAFKLAFLGYVSVLIALCPLLALDGHLLLADWLEIPQLRSRSRAWLRRQRDADDVEGRLIARYGILAVIWVVLAVIIAYRMWTDRISALCTGLAHRSGLSLLLLVVLLVALVAPLAAELCRMVAARAARRITSVWHSLVTWRAARATARGHDPMIDPRARAALADSPLGGLPESALTRLAAWSRWVKAISGSQLISAGAEHPDVFLVVEGVLEARAPGDPVGTVRERVRAGGLIGLARAVTDRPSALHWYTASPAIVLALPAKTVSATVGPLPGPNLVERVSIESLLCEVEALVGRSEEDILGLVAQARPIELEQGETLTVHGRDTAMVVETGIMSLDGGRQAGRGDLIGPLTSPSHRSVGVALIPARLWSLTGITDLPPQPANLRSAPGERPQVGSHPSSSYPPLAGPPRVPDSQRRSGPNHSIERGLSWIGALALGCVIPVLISFAWLCPAYAEAPGDRIVLTATTGTTTVVVDGVSRDLSPGDRAFIGRSDTVTTPTTATATLTFHGGASAVLCSGTAIEVESSSLPASNLVLDRGLLLVDTDSDDPSNSATSLEITTPTQETIANRGASRYAVAASDLAVIEGAVTRDDVLIPPTATSLTCSDGTALAEDSAGTTASARASHDGLTSEDVIPSPSTSAPSPSASVSASAPSASAAPSQTATTPTPQPQTTTPTDHAPTLTWETMPGGPLTQLRDGSPCGEGATSVTVAVTATDDHGVVSVYVSWSGYASGANAMSASNSIYQGEVGPITASGDGTTAGWLTVSVTATDSTGQSTTISATVDVNACSALG